MPKAVAAVLGVAAVLSAAGCSGEATPEQSPESTTPVSDPLPSPEPSNSVRMSPLPGLPAAAKTDSVEGATAFVRYYFSLVNYAYSSGEVSELVDVSDPRCASCSDLVASIKEGYSGDGRLRGGSVTVGEIATTPGEADIGLSSRILIGQEPIESVSPDGRELELADGVSELLLEVLIKWDGNEWVVLEWAADDGR